ncbi:MAG: hypothetical protein NUV74_06920 [Candidatus Brocadiaceae bacterium]|nr:hypothetical protein [Candidatus Brocadiaceae bacterium]
MRTKVRTTTATLKFLYMELTAIPKVERSGGAIKFKNVVYEYSLAKAIQDGFVEEPAVATRKDFDPSQYSDKVVEIHSSQAGMEK